MAFISRIAVEIFCMLPFQMLYAFGMPKHLLKCSESYLSQQGALCLEAPGGHRKNGPVLTGHTSWVHPLHHPWHQSGRKGAILCNSFQVYLLGVWRKDCKNPTVVHSSRPGLFCKYIKWTLEYNLGLSLFQCIKGWVPTYNKAGHDQGLSIHSQN